MKLVYEDTGDVQMSEDLKLYKLIQKYAIDLGWMDEGTSFCIWIPLSDVDEFVQNLRKIVGDEYFQDDGMCVKIQLENVIFEELNMIFDELDFEGMFDKTE
jgi:hypothetical protein